MTRRPVRNTALYAAYIGAEATIVVLKLAGVVNWSWWLIFSPQWIPLLVIGALLAISRPTTR